MWKRVIQELCGSMVSILVVVDVGCDDSPVSPIPYDIPVSILVVVDVGCDDAKYIQWYSLRTVSILVVVDVGCDV